MVSPRYWCSAADRNVFMIDSNSERISSGDASGSASPGGPAGSTMCGAVIVMTPFESALERFHSKDRAVAAPRPSPTRQRTRRRRYTAIGDSSRNSPPGSVARASPDPDVRTIAAWPRPSRRCDPCDCAVRRRDLRLTADVQVGPRPEGTTQHTAPTRAGPVTASALRRSAGRMPGFALNPVTQPCTSRTGPDDARSRR